MGQVNVRVQLVNAAKFIATFAILSVITVAIAPATSHAEAGNPVLPPAVVIPAACNVAPPEVFVSGIQVAPNTPTNTSGLQWNWSFTPPATAEGDAPFVVDAYSYAIYNGTMLQSQGTLTADATTLGYAAPTDGTYSLYLWTIEGAGEPTYCSVGSISLDTTPPVIVNNGYTLDSTTGIATPLLSTDETDVTYNWAVDGLNNGVQISDSTVLNPTFTFQLDDTYTFTLTATDSFGNSTTVPLSIVYLAPFIASPTKPNTIPEETVPDPVQSYTPFQQAVPRVYSTPTPANDGKLPPAVDASIYASTAQGRDASSTSEKNVAGVVTAGQNGWKIVGVVWYWWILIGAIIATAWLWVVRTYRNQFLLTPDDI